MKCFESALEVGCRVFSHLRISWCSVSPIRQVDSKMNLANKNLGAIYGSMGRMVLLTRITALA